MEPIRRDVLSFSRTERLLGQRKTVVGGNAPASRLGVEPYSPCARLRPRPATHLAYGMRTSYIVFKAALTELILLAMLYLTLLETFMARPRLEDFPVIVALWGSVVAPLGS